MDEHLSGEDCLDEKETVARARRGDEAAWVEIVRTHEQPMFRLAYLLLGDADEAQDAAQEALIRAHKYLHRFDAERELRPWLLSIVANLGRNRKRSMGRYWGALKRWGQEQEANPESVSARVRRQESSQALWQAVRTLNDADQEVIYLRFFLDLSVRESAEALDVAEGTVKSRTSRALGRLKARIESRFPELAEELA